MWGRFFCVRLAAKRLLVCLFALAAVGLAASGVAAKVLSVGDSAPAIEVKKFVKGSPVAGFAKGQFYVVAFWATGSAPCKGSILHLTQLQSKFKNVVFIGVSVFEADPSQVEPFVKEMGDRIDYRVAQDSVPDGQTGAKGVMATSWLSADPNSVPLAFIIDKENKIAWIGHPMDMDHPLSKIVAGTWDLNAEAALQAKIAEAYTWEQRGNFPKALSIIEQILKAEPDMESALAMMKFQLLVEGGKEEEATAWGSKLIEGIFKDDQGALNQLAWNLVDPGNPRSSPPLVSLAVKAATRADTLARGKDPACADTLATAYFAQGKIDKAIETEERAVKLAKDAPMEADLNKNLLKFRQAKK